VLTICLETHWLTDIYMLTLNVLFLMVSNFLCLEAYPPSNAPTKRENYHELSAFFPFPWVFMENVLYLARPA